MQAVLSRKSHGAVHLVRDGGTDPGRLARADLRGRNREQRALIVDTDAEWTDEAGVRPDLLDWETVLSDRLTSVQPAASSRS